MARVTVALAVLALFSVAHAERSLQAHKASGGSSLHGLALTDNTYYTTNGNGTWSSNTNRAYTQKSACLTSASISLANPPPFFTVASGITDVSFPSRLLGVAVGVGCTGFDAYDFQDSTTVTHTTDITVFPAVATGTPSAIALISFTPNIMTTFDQGATWQVVTGFSSTKSFAQTRQQNNLAPITPTSPAFPSPDLLSVHCTTRSLCFAAGGYIGNFQASAGLNTASTGTYRSQVVAVVTASTTATTPTIIPKVLPVGGVVLRSTNGGTYWNYVTLPVAIAATGTLPPQPIAGLTNIATDSSGRHVYAVGAPFFTNDYTYPTSTNFEAPSSAGPGNAAAAVWGGATVVSPAVASGTIIYSGSYGVSNSWVLQTAPKIPSFWYSLNSVHVLRGTSAIAVGGSPFGVTADDYAKMVTAASGTTYSLGAGAPLASSGIILMTLNGGFSWIQQTIPSWTFWSGSISDASCTTCANTLITAQSTSANLPQLYDAACYSTVQNSTAMYCCMAVGASGYVVKSYIPAITVSNTVTTAVSSWMYQNITQVAQTTGYLDLYGITWDNNMVGYMFGEQTILSTHNGGITWVSETPNGIVAGLTTATTVVSVATVPTSY